MIENSSRERTPGRGPRIALITLIAVVIVVVVAAVLAVLLRSGPTAFDPQSPEGVVQRYTQAVIAGDLETAQQLILPTDSLDGCGYYPGGTEDYRVVLVGSTVNGDTAHVQVLITTTYAGGLFGSGEYQSEEVITLRQSPQGWMIATAPWQFTVCPEGAP